MDTKLTREARVRLARKRHPSTRAALAEQGYYKTTDPSVRESQD